MKKKEFKITGYLITIIVFLIVVMMMPTNVSAVDYAPAKNITYTCTGDQAEDIVGIAKTQIGYVDNGVNTVYGAWYGVQTEWCAMFVSWCADKAGISTSIVPKLSSADRQWYKDRGIYKKSQYWGGTYIPKRGDIIFFSWKSVDYADHVGIVDKVSGGYVYTIEGNSSSSVVAKKSYSLSNAYILGYGTPKYKNSKTYTLRYSDGDSSTSYDEDEKIIPRQTIKSGVSTKTSTKSFTKSGYHYDYWYIFQLVDGKAHYYCRNKTTGGDAGWYAYDAIPSTHKKVSFAHGGSIYFTITRSNIVIYLTPAWERNTYTLRYSDGISSSSYDTDEKIIPRQTIESGVSTKTTDIKFTRTGYYYDNWYIFTLVDGKAHYWCRNKTTGGDGHWYAYDSIPSTHKKVSFPHGGSIYFTLKHGSTIYLTPAWKTTIDLEDICDGSDEILLSETAYTYDGKAKKPSVTVPGLTIGEDYTVSYANNINPGKATVAITGIGTYTGTVTKTFTITSKKTGWQEIDGTWYYFKNGATVKGWLKTGGVWYYFDGKGMMQTGLKIISGEKYYFKSSGAMKTGWQEINSTWYYFKSSGAAAEGWQKVSKKWYYFNDENEMVTGLQIIGGAKYYLDNSGAMKIGWKQIDSIWYYFKSSGAAAEGWQKISNKWYYFNEDNEMLTGAYTINGSMYYFKSDGTMTTGWYKIGTDWFYFNNSGASVEGWLKLDKYWYYFEDDGSMVTGIVQIGNEKHGFTDSGAWLGEI